MDLSDIQGIVLYGYNEARSARYLHLSLPTGAPARAWLAAIRPELTAVAGFLSTPREEQNLACRVNVAFTTTGLSRLGLSADEISGFARELQQGMAHPERSRVLGDQNDDAPGSWELGGPENERIDALLMLFGNDEALERLVQRHRQQAEAAGARIVADQTAALDETGREHFGFADGIGQPHVAGSGRPPRRGQRTAASGEFVLGHPDAYAVVPPPVVVRARAGSHLPDAGSGKLDLGRNGSYLVYRKLEQDVAGFWRTACEQTRRDGASTTRHAVIQTAARMVGRWPSGAPLVLRPRHDDPQLGRTDDFGYTGDPHGIACPIGSHVRRTNPRDSLEPSPAESLTQTGARRILRRGRAYGPRLVDPRTLEGSGELPPPEPSGAAAAERGLVFIALCASIRRQFEFVQQTWVNSTTFARLDGERDPLIGGDFRDGDRSFSVPGEPVRARMNGLPRFVRLRGGGYFFVPAMKAIEHLAAP